ncbi:sigma-70 family RNA polymerase sigma factor [Candidatus Palauibacter sp.]|uniref:sigma-70 family RNA polymerase sigma factor n=1 Tax=Candidatus Palauibacter sp. TaxID=3101350 RepID=UPI003B01DA53
MRPAGTDRDGGAPVEATDELLKALWPVVRGVAAGYARDRDEREDLAQECLLRIADKLPKYRREGGSVGAWARVVAENRCRSLRRADPAGGWVGLDECREIRAEMPSADDLVERAEANEALTTAAGRLSNDERAAVALCCFDGLDYREAGEELGLPAGAVRRLVRCGVHLMRNDPCLAAWSPSSRWPASAAAEGLAPSSGEVPVLALEPNPDARDHVRRGVEDDRLGGLLDGVWFASDWSELRNLIDRLPGCPTFLDAQSRDGDDWSADLKTLHEDFPNCPIIAHGRVDGPWFRGSLARDVECVAVLRRDVDDDPPHVRGAVLRASDRHETEFLLSRLREETPRRMHRALGVVVRDTVEPCSVAGLAVRAGLPPRTLRRWCEDSGLPAPHRLLSLARIYHVERLARWSRHGRGAVARALGFPGASPYWRVVRRELGGTPGEIERRGGPDYVADAIAGGAP